MRIRSTATLLTLLATLPSLTLAQSSTVDVECGGAKIGELRLDVDARNFVFQDGGASYRSIGANATGGFVLTDRAARDAACWCDSYRWFQVVDVTSTLPLGGGAPTFGLGALADPLPTTPVEWGGGVVTADHYPFYWGNPAGACGHGAATGRNPVPGMPGKTWDLYYEDGPGFTFAEAAPPGPFSATFDFVTCLACVGEPLAGDGRNRSGSFKVLAAIRWSVTMRRDAAGTYDVTVGAPAAADPASLPGFVATGLAAFNARPGTGTWSLATTCAPCPPPRTPRVGLPLPDLPGIALPTVPLSFDPLTQQLELPAMPPLFLDLMGVDGPPQFLSDPVLDGVVGSLTYRYLGEFGGEHRFVNDTQGFNLFVDDPLDLPGQTLFVDPLLAGLHPGNPNGWLTPLTGDAPLLILDPLAAIPLQVPILDPLADPLGSGFMPHLLPPIQEPGLELSLQGFLTGDLVQATQNFTQPGQVQVQPFITFTQPLFVGQPYCDPAPVNSTGLPGSLFVTGSPTVQDDFMLLHSVDLPPLSAGFILASPGQVFVPNPGGSQGELCVGPDIGRGVGGVIFNSGPLGEATVLADLLAVPTPGGPVPMQPGITWHFQTWYRDSSPAGATSNLTNAVEVSFQ